MEVFHRLHLCTMLYNKKLLVRWRVLLCLVSPLIDLRQALFLAVAVVRNIIEDRIDAGRLTSSPDTFERLTLVTWLLLFLLLTPLTPCELRIALRCCFVFA